MRCSWGRKAARKKYFDNEIFLGCRPKEGWSMRSVVAKRIRNVAVIGLNLILCLAFVNSSWAQELKTAAQKPLRFGVAAWISPKDTISVYQQILYYVGEQLGRPVEMVQRKTYAEMDELVKTRQVDFAFICSAPYVKEHADFGAELIAAPQSYGEKVYYSYIIVNKESPVADFDGLKGRSFAFVEENSNTGCIVPKYMLAKKGETADTFFSKYEYSGNHDKSIEMVANKTVDAAAVDHLIWEYFNAKNPKFTSQTKILLKSPPYGMPPVVTHPATDSQLKKRVQEILLNMHNDPAGKAILAQVYIDRFYLPEDKDYETVRDMKKWLETSDKK